MAKETEIAVRQPQELVPAEVEWSILKEKAQIAVACGMFMTKNVAQALAIILTGKELGIGPFQSLRGIHLIQGRPSLSADMMMALAYARVSGFRADVSMNPAGTEAVGRFWRDGMTEPYISRFSMDDAKRAGLAGKDIWVKYPENMLRARVRADGARVIAPEVCMGLYTPDELGAIVTIDQAGQEIVRNIETTTVDTSTGELQEATPDADDGDSDFLIVLCADCGEAIPAVITVGSKQYNRLDWLKRSEAKFRAQLCLKCSMDRAEVLKREAAETA